MLKVDFVVDFDKNGNIKKVRRICKIPRPSCEGCKFKKWCDRIENSIRKGGIDVLD